MGNRLGEANVLKAQGDVLAFMDERQAALAKYEAALGLFRAMATAWARPTCSRRRGTCSPLMDERQAALAKYKAALGPVPGHGRPPGQGQRAQGAGGRARLYGRTAGGAGEV